MDEKHLPILESLKTDRIRAVAIVGAFVILWGVIGSTVKASIQTQMELQRDEIIRAVKNPSAAPMPPPAPSKVAP